MSLLSSKLCVCCIAHDDEDNIARLLDNVVAMGSVFEGYKIIVSYASSHDNTLKIILERMKSDRDIDLVLINQDPKLMKHASERRSISRNACLAHMHKQYSATDYPVFVMIDCTKYTSSSLCKSTWRTCMEQADRWDALSFWARHMDMEVQAWSDCTHNVWKENQPNGFAKRDERIRADYDTATSRGDTMIDMYMSFQDVGVFKRAHFAEARYVSSETSDHFWGEYDTEHRSFFEEGNQCGARMKLHTSPLFEEERCEKTYDARYASATTYFSLQDCANACDFHPSSGIEYRRPVSEYMHKLQHNEMHRPYMRLCIPPSLLDEFVAHYIHYIRAPFFLVTISPSRQSEDKPNWSIFHVHEKTFQTIVRHPHLVTWYCTDLTLNGFPKIEPLPRGIDMRTSRDDALELEVGQSLSVKSARWSSLEEKQERMASICAQKTLGEKDVCVLCTSHFFLDSTGERKNAMEEIPADLLLVPATIPSSEEWMELVGRNAFVLCPYGETRDTSDVWEVLALGSIPIVKKDAMCALLYADLPVMQVSSWRDVTMDSLRATLEKLKEGSFSYQKLKLRYWLDKFAPK